MADDPSWNAWVDANGDAMFVADGAKSPVLVRARYHGAEEYVLAVFTSTESAVIFQEWMSQSFEGTALANHQLSLGARETAWGMAPHTAADEREDEADYRPPWLGPE